MMSSLTSVCKSNPGMLKQATSCPLCALITVAMNIDSIATVGNVVSCFKKDAVLLLALVGAHARLYQSVPLLLDKHEQQEGFLLLIVGQGLHLDRAEHTHIMHLSELLGLGHSCFVPCLKKN